MTKTEAMIRIRQAMRDARNCGAFEIIENLKPVLAGIKMARFAQPRGAKAGKNIPKLFQAQGRMIYMKAKSKGNVK